TSSWLALGFLALLVTPLGQGCQNLALQRLDASEVANFSNASPLLTLIWGVLLFGEVLTPALVVGSSLTLWGIYWTGRRHQDASQQVSDTTSVTPVLPGPVETAPERSEDPGAPAEELSSPVAVDRPRTRRVRKTKWARTARPCRSR